MCALCVVVTAGVKTVKTMSFRTRAEIVPPIHRNVIVENPSFLDISQYLYMVRGMCFVCMGVLCYGVCVLHGVVLGCGSWLFVSVCWGVLRNGCWVFKGCVYGLFVLWLCLGVL